MAADAPDGSSIEFGAIQNNGLPRDDGLTITVDATATLSTDATLSALTVDDGTTEHTINLATTPYTVDVGNAVEEVTLTATPTHTGASVSAVTLGGTAIADTDFTDGITVPSLAEGDNVIVVTVTAEDGSTTETYTVTVTREATTHRARRPTVPGAPSSDGGLTVRRRAGTTSGHQHLPHRPFDLSDQLDRAVRRRRLRRSPATTDRPARSSDWRPAARAGTRFRGRPTPSPTRQHHQRPTPAFPAAPPATTASRRSTRSAPAPPPTSTTPPPTTPSSPPPRPRSTLTGT